LNVFPFFQCLAAFPHIYCARFKPVIPFFSTN
jgi:hypothetical protein